jgi:hypothetical protein
VRHLVAPRHPVVAQAVDGGRRRDCGAGAVPRHVAAPALVARRRSPRPTRSLGIARARRSTRPPVMARGSRSHLRLAADRRAASRRAVREGSNPRLKSRPAAPQGARPRKIESGRKRQPPKSTNFEKIPGLSTPEAAQLRLGWIKRAAYGHLQLLLLRNPTARRVPRSQKKSGRFDPPAPYHYPEARRHDAQ